MANTLITQLNNPAVLQKLNSKGALVTSILLVIACAYQLAQLTWMLVPQEQSAAQAVPAASRPVSSNLQNPQNRIRQLAAANLFGTAQDKKVQAETAPETKLNLTLKGVLAAVPMELASAIISQGKAGKEDIYSVGDRLPGGVLVKEIHAEHVMLERNGRLETLKLQKESGEDDILSSGSDQGSGSSRLRSLTSSASPGEALNEIRSEIMKNPTSFADYALPIVVKENGQQIGYRLEPQKKGELLSELGIQSGDVITQINGVKLDKQQNGISALRKLTTASNVNIVVKRNGAEIPLNISLK